MMTSPMKFLFLAIFFTFEYYEIFISFFSFVFHCFSFIKSRLNITTTSESTPNCCPISLDKPISLSDYDRLSVDFTKQELEKLRNYVKSPSCNQFDIFLRLRNAKNFARAVEFNEMRDVPVCVDDDVDEITVC